MNSGYNWDYLQESPFKAFKNAGFYAYRGGWRWNSNQDYDCFYYIKKGTIRAQFSDETLLAAEGDMLFVEMGQPVILSAPEADISYYFVSFYRQEGAQLAFCRHTKRSGLEGLMADIMQAHRAGSELSKLQRAYLFLKLAWLCARKENAEVTQLHAAIEYINIHFDSKITLDALCSVSGYSPAHLRRLFQKECGLSPQQYIIHKRIEAAKERLKENQDKSLEEMALSLGFCSASHFIQRFKADTGLTPLAYQNIYAKPTIDKMQTM